MTPPAVGLGTLRRLSEMGGGGALVLSVYLDVDARGRLCEQAQALRRHLSRLTPHAAAPDVRRVDAMLRSMPEPAYGTRGLALFSAAEGSAFASIPLPASVGTMAVVDTIPWLEPLAGTFTSGDWGVALVDRRSARLLRGGPTGLVEFAALRDEPHRNPLLGDSCQIGAHCLIEERLAEHAERVATLLARAHRRRAFERLAVVAPQELWPAIEQALHSDLRGRLAGLVALDLQDMPAHEVARALAEIVSQAEDGRMRTPGTSTATAPRSAMRPTVRSSSTCWLPLLLDAQHAGAGIDDPGVIDPPSRATGAIRHKAAA